MDVSAIEFNKKHNMDWNKWINEGVPFIEIKKCKKISNEIQSLNKNEEPTFNFKNPEDKMNADTTIDLFKDWYQSGD